MQWGTDLRYSKAFDLLVVLVEQYGRLMERDSLMGTVPIWMRSSVVSNSECRYFPERSVMWIMMNRSVADPVDDDQPWPKFGVIQKPPPP
jgi:hypothetical protein